MSFQVKQITVKSGMDDFLSIPPEIYRNDPNWIVPQSSEIRRILSPGKNPYFGNASLRLYVCYQDGKPVCRSISVINPLHWEKWKKKSAFFGFFESINDSTAVKYLFDKIEEDCHASGAEYLEGPFNPNHYSELGILTDNFNSAPIFYETYNPPYYLQLLKDAGFSELYKIHTRINYNISETLTRKFKSSGDFKYKNITIRKFNIFRPNRDLEILREINNDAFENNWYFLPLSKEEYRFSAKFLFLVATPSLILFAEYKGKPVGVVQFAINFNSLIRAYGGQIKLWDLPGLLLKRRKVKELVIFTVGIKKAFRNSGILRVLIRAAVKIFRKYDTISTTWMSEEDRGDNPFELFELKPYKHFAIFSKQL